MRLISLLLTLLVVGWLIYSQLGHGGPGQSEQAAYQQAEAKAAAVQVQVDDQFARQAGQLQQMEAGEAPVQP
ncbi:MAG TPA: hypothetical protein VFV15_05710 [Moraxellaceae bacterium]|nr:hypothetical protein [Moraxellaceae bacterium]